MDIMKAQKDADPMKGLSSAKRDVLMERARQMGLTLSDGAVVLPDQSPPPAEVVTDSDEFLQVSSAASVAFDPAADLIGVGMFPEPDPEPTGDPGTPDFGDATPDFGSDSELVLTMGREVLAFFREEFGRSKVLGLGVPCIWIGPSPQQLLR